MKYRILFSISILLGTIVFFSWTNIRKPVSDSTTKGQKMNALEMYGEALYQREKCVRCHTLHIEEATDKIVSLDGVGGLYPDSWMFYYLNDPSTMTPGSLAPSYRELFMSPFNEKLVKKIIADKKLTISIENFIDSLKIQSKKLIENLRQEDIYAPRSEGFALIAYMQQIPISEKKYELDKKRKELDSIEFSIQFEAGKTWLNNIWESNSIIFQTAANQESIAKGEALFVMNCAVCHGLQGRGMIGPNLTDNYWLHGPPTALNIAKVIANGVPEKGMISWQQQFSPEEIGTLVAYVQSLKGTNPENAKEEQGELYE